MRHYSTYLPVALIAAFLVTATASNAFATASIILDYNSAKILGSVHIDGGTIDVTNGAMIVTTSSFGFVPVGGQAGEDMVNGVGQAEYGDAAIHDAIVEGADFSNGYWNGTNGIVSSVAANDPTNQTAVGWIDNSAIGYDSFRGVPLTSQQSIISYCYVGDCFLTGVVDGTDEAEILYSIAHPPAHPDWSDGDINYDGVVDSKDLALFWDVYNSHLPSLGYVPDYTFVPAFAVPEPGAIGLVLTVIATLTVFSSHKITSYWANSNRTYRPLS